MDKDKVVTYYYTDTDGDEIEQDLVETDDGEFLDPEVAFGEPE